MNELWLQEQVANNAVSINKINNKFNLADLLTKYLTAAEIDHIIDFMQHSFLDGRSEVAPALSLVQTHNPFTWMEIEDTGAEDHAKGNDDNSSTTLPQCVSN